MSHLLSCPACGLFGWRRHQRARHAAQVAERGLIAYWQGLGARSRAERRPTARLAINLSGCPQPLRRWLTGDPAPAAASTAGIVGIASAYRHLDHALAARR